MLALKSQGDSGDEPSVKPRTIRRTVSHAYLTRTHSNDMASSENPAQSDTNKPGLKTSNSSPSLVDLIATPDPAKPRSTSIPPPKITTSGIEYQRWWSVYSREPSWIVGGSKANRASEVIDFIDDSDAWSQVSVDSAVTDHSQKSGTCEQNPSKKPVAEIEKSPQLTPNPIRPSGEVMKRPMILQWLTRHQFAVNEPVVAPAAENKLKLGGGNVLESSSKANRKQSLPDSGKNANIARRMRELNATAPQTW